jgi:very-short-patch-repair endonuclease
MTTGRSRETPDYVKRRMNSRGWVDHKLVIECDGHDFHDRTKVQASRDRARDRTLQSLGFQVFRYTGADIWRDVMACATEVLDALTTEMRRVWQEARRTDGNA